MPAHPLDYHHDDRGLADTSNAEEAERLEMIRYIIGRLLWIIPVLFVVTVITFGLMHAVPGGPWSREKRVPAATEAALNIKYGLDDPVPVQYVRWVTDLLQGNLGPSYKFRRPHRSMTSSPTGSGPPSNSA